jgi:hypothetical protein
LDTSTFAAGSFSAAAPISVGSAKKKYKIDIGKERYHAVIMRTQVQVQVQG